MNARVGGGREPDASPIISCAPGSLLLGSPGRHAFLNHAVTFGVRERSGRTVLSATLAGVATTAWISLVRLSTPKCDVGCISGSRALSAFLVEDGALMIVWPPSAP
jgi:hypothetical protein